MTFKREEIVRSKTHREQAIAQIAEGIVQAAQKEGLTITAENAELSAIEMLCKMFDLSDEMKLRLKSEYGAA